jgi:hypothetical protein
MARQRSLQRPLQLPLLSAGGLGPHGSLLLAEMQRAAAAGLPLSVLVLAAALADVAVQELPDMSPDMPPNMPDNLSGDAPDGPDRLGTGYLSADEVRELDWLRRRRNQILHHDKAEGQHPFALDTSQLDKDAGRAARALAPLLDWLAGG